MSTVPAEQYRIELVQVLNWGGFGGLQVMQAGRASTAILGPSGRGKSTLLDGIASVVMPNPQEFNQAARDDKRKQEQQVATDVEQKACERVIRQVGSQADGHQDEDDSDGPPG